MPPPSSPPRTTQPRKTLTYAEQLQQLQPPKELYRSGEGGRVNFSNTIYNQCLHIHSLYALITNRLITAPTAGATFKRAHGPSHKPKTYVQQLQELQQPVSPRRRPTRSRPGPYANPYMDVTGDDDSAASPWSLDHDLHNILYDGEESSFHVSSNSCNINKLT